jgi:hypothetical protein
MMARLKFQLRKLRAKSVLNGSCGTGTVRVPPGLYPFGPLFPLSYSHSMVPGGLLVMSSATRFTPGTSLMMRLLMRSSNA